MLELLQYRSWALSESYFSRMFPIVAERLRTGRIDELVKKRTIEEIFPRIQALLAVDGIKADITPSDAKLERDPWTGAWVIPTVKSGGKTIGIIPIVGPLTKYGEMCTLGMQAYQGIINQANADEKIDGIVLLMDTPGGTVDGTPEFGFSIKNNPKPIGVFGDGMVASAGMWIASQAAVIVGNKNNPTQFGSIGTLMISENWQNVIDAGNMPKMEIIRAPQSTEKALVNGIEPLTEALREDINAELKEITEMFIATVKEGRGEALDVKAEGLFKGRMYDVTTAKKIGLITAVGTLQTAVNKVADLVRQKKKYEGSNNSNSNTQMSKFKKLSALLGAAVSLFFPGGEKEASLTTEQAASLEASEKKLTEMEEEAAKFKADNEAQSKKITELEATVSELKTQITKLEGDNKTLTTEKADLQTKLDASPTAGTTTVIAGKHEAGQAADQGATREKPTYETSVDRQVREIREAQNSTQQPIK